MDQIENFLFRILVTQKKIHRQKGIKMQRKSINRSFTHSSLRSRSSRFHLSASIDLVFSRTPKKMDPPMPIHRTRGSMPCHFPTQSDQPLRAHEIQQLQTWDADDQWWGQASNARERQRNAMNCLKVLKLFMQCRWRFTFKKALGPSSLKIVWAQFTIPEYWVPCPCKCSQHEIGQSCKWQFLCGI